MLPRLSHSSQTQWHTTTPSATQTRQHMLPPSQYVSAEKIGKKRTSGGREPLSPLHPDLVLPPVRL